MLLFDCLNLENLFCVVVTKLSITFTDKLGDKASEQKVSNNNSNNYFNNICVRDFQNVILSTGFLEVFFNFLNSDAVKPVIDLN